MDCCWGHWWRCCHDNQRLKTQQILACILWYICTIKICLMLPYLLYINEGSTLVQTFIWFGFFGLKNKMFLHYFFSRLVLFVDITRVLSLIVIKPLLEDSLVNMNPFTFFSIMGLTSLSYIKLQLKDSLFYDMCTLLHYFKSWTLTDLSSKDQFPQHLNMGKNGLKGAVKQIVTA